MTTKIKKYGLFESTEDSSVTQKFVDKIKKSIDLDRLMDKFDDKVGNLPDKLKAMLCDKVKGELRWI